MFIKPNALAGICCIAGALLAGCGSSSPGTAQTEQGRQTPLMSSPDTGSAHQQSGHPRAALGQLPSGGSSSAAGANGSRVPSGKVAKARLTPDTSNDDKTTAGDKPLNPCKLVSLSEAQAISGGAITRMAEAPLGPTCIYSGTSHAAGVTLAVETEGFGQATRNMSARKRVVISGHRSICGRLGTQMLFVPLDRYRLLNVTAPCGIAQRFATLAVGRLSA